MISTNYLLLLAPFALQLVGLVFAVWSDPYIGSKNRRVMFCVIALIAALIAQNITGYRLDQDGTQPFLRTLNAIFGYSVRPVILLLFFYIVGNRKSYWLAWLLVGINCAVYMTACFSRICFWIDAANAFHRGPLGYTCHVVSALLLCELVYLSFHEYVPGRRQEAWIPLANAALIVGSVVLDSFVDYRDMPTSYLTVAVVSSTLFYYIWLHLQFARRHEQDLMAEQRIQIMMTQIQPHFLYNTLSTIQALCSIDPQQAAVITGKFSAYLRQNLNSLEYPGLTSFEKELEHTWTYADIEQVRFPNIRIEYAIEDTGFSLPFLTVQPIVENAIRHGVRIREEGVIRVVARKTEGGHEVVISDNGIGFDVKTLEQNDGTHIGLKNVQERIEKMCGGSVTVVSQPDRGTTVTVFIPDREEEKA